MDLRHARWLNKGSMEEHAAIKEYLLHNVGPYSGFLFYHFLSNLTLLYPSCSYIVILVLSQLILNLQCLSLGEACGLKPVIRYRFIEKKTYLYFMIFFSKSMPINYQNLFSFLQCPEFLDLEKTKLKSKESLSSGVHLNTASEDNLTSLLKQDSDLSIELHPQPRKSYLHPIRHPSLTESSTSTVGTLGLHRHVSDPGLPGK